MCWWMLTPVMFLCLLHDGVRRLADVVYSVPPSVDLDVTPANVPWPALTKGHRAAVTCQGSLLIWLQSPRSRIAERLQYIRGCTKEKRLVDGSILALVWCRRIWRFPRSLKAEWRHRLVSRIKHEMVSICRCQRVLYRAVGAMRTMSEDIGG